MSVTFETFRGTEEGKIVAGTTTRTLGPSEVHIETTHSGLCGTDELYVKASICLGQEGIGVVRQTGSAVSSEGWDQHCENKREYGFHDHDQGSFGSGVVWDESCVVPIPDGYVLEFREQTRRGNLLWCFRISCGQIRGDTPACKPVKHLLLCGSSNPDYTGLVPLMSPRSAIYPIVVDMAPTPVVTPLLNMNGIRIQGSLTASRRALRSLMEFCAAKNIKPTSMTFHMTAEGIEEAMETLRQGKMRYRGVLVRQSHHGIAIPR